MTPSILLNEMPDREFRNKTGSKTVFYILMVWSFDYSHKVSIRSINMPHTSYHPVCRWCKTICLWQEYGKLHITLTYAFLGS